MAAHPVRKRPVRTQPVRTRRAGGRTTVSVTSQGATRSAFGRRRAAVKGKQEDFRGKSRRR